MPQYIQVGNETIEFPDGMTDAQIAQAIRGMSTSTQAPISSSFLMGLKDPISGGAQLLPRGLEAVTSLGGLAPNPVSRFFGSEAQRVDEIVRREQEAYESQRKAQGDTGFDVGRLAGNIINPTTLVGGVGAAPVTRALTAGATAGALQPVVTQEGESFAEQKAVQTGGGAAFGIIGSGATKAVGKVLNPLTSKAEQTMRELGVQLTPGQMAGGQAKDIETFAANIPLIGQNIANAKERALFSFNKGVINKALDKLGQKLPEDVIGRDAVAFAQDSVDAAYDDVLSKVNFKLDFGTYSGMLKASRLPTASADRVRVQDELKARVFDRLPQNGEIDGQTFKQIESDLRIRINQLNKGSVSDQDVAKALRGSLDSLRTGLRKQNPKETPRLRRIDSAYSDIAVMEDAAQRTNTMNGVFTPKQYQAAVKAGDVTKRKRQFAAGRARNQEVSGAAVEVMEEAPGYNLTGRQAYNLAGVAGLLSSAASAPALAVIAPAMYSESGLRVMNSLMRSRPDVARRIGDELTKRSVREGSITAVNVLEAYNKATQAEAGQ
jgi:DnaJ-domain-containing protein 1